MKIFPLLQVAPLFLLTITLWIGGCGGSESGTKDETEVGDAGSENFDLGDSDGQGELRIYGAGDCDRCISLPKSSFEPGEETVISWHNVEDPSDDNWIGGFASPDAPSMLFQTWLDQYIEDESGSVRFTVPEKPGVYEIRLHYDGDYYTGESGVNGASDLQFTVIGEVVEEVDDRPYPTAVKNVILMIGDGLANPHVELTAHVTGTQLTMQSLDPNPASMTTDSLSGVTDSAAAGTAIATGHKTRNGRVGMLYDRTVVESILERAESIGKATGLVTNDRIYGGTPSAFAAHVESRSYKINIVNQMVEKEIEVLLGAGSDRWIPEEEEGSDRSDDRDLTQEKREAGWTYVNDRDGLLSVAPDTDRLIGLFALNDMNYVLDRERAEVVETEPTLAEMTNAALTALDNNESGFFLMVEAARIDWGGDSHDPGVVVSEMIEFDSAVATARVFADANPDTLLIVTADHECCGLQFTGEEDITALLAQTASVDWIEERIDDGMSAAQAMSIFAGITELSAQDLEWIEENGNAGIGDVLSRHMNVSWNESGFDGYGHTNDNVPLFSYGAQADLFDGEIDNAKLGEMLFHAISGSGPQ